MKSKHTRRACKHHTEMEPNLKAFLLCDNIVNHWWLLMLQIKKQSEEKACIQELEVWKDHLNALHCIPQARLETQLLCFWLICLKASFWCAINCNNNTLTVILVKFYTRANHVNQCSINCELKAQKHTGQTVDQTDYMRPLKACFTLFCHVLTVTLLMIFYITQEDSIDLFIYHSK